MNENPEGLQSADFFRVIWRRRFTILLITLAGGAFTYFYASTRPAVYSAMARYEVKRFRYDPEQGEQRVFITTRDQRTFAEVAKSKEVTRRLAERMAQSRASAGSGARAEDFEGILSGAVDVGAVEGANLIEITARASNPDLAAEIANVLGSVLGEQFVREAERERRKYQSFLDEKLSEYEVKIQDLQRKVSVFDERTAERANQGLDPSPARYRELAEGEKRATARLERVVRDRERLQLLGADPALAGEEDVEILSGAGSSGGARKAFDALREAEAERNRMSERYTEIHPNYQRAADEVEKRQADFRAAVGVDSVRRLRALESELLAANAEMGEIQVRLRELRRIAEDIPRERLERSNLDQELSSSLSLYHRLRERKEQNDLQISNLPRDEMAPVDVARPPAAPSYPNVQAMIFVGTSIGFLIAIAMAFFLESLDTAISTLAEVERLSGHPVLAIIPPIRIAREDAEAVEARYGIDEALHLPVLSDPRSPSAEAYRTLRTVLEYSFFSQGKRTLLITSATPAEGKTTTLANLALASASAGRRTLVVGANLRHPVLSRIFASDDSIPGLSNLLAGEADLADVIQETAFPDLHILDAGNRLSRPAELLAAPILPQALAALAQAYDAVLVDSPPVLPVADAASMAPHCDGALLVYFVGVPPRGAFLRAVTTLEATGGKLVGIVLNDIREASIEQFTQYYYYHRYPDVKDASPSHAGGVS